MAETIQLRPNEILHLRALQANVLAAQEQVKLAQAALVGFTSYLVLEYGIGPTDPIDLATGILTTTPVSNGTPAPVEG